MDILLLCPWPTLVSPLTSWHICMRLQPLLDSLGRSPPSTMPLALWNSLLPEVLKIHASFSSAFIPFKRPSLASPSLHCLPSPHPHPPLTQLFYFWNSEYLKLSCWFVYFLIIHCHLLSHTRKIRTVMYLVNWNSGQKLQERALCAQLLIHVWLFATPWTIAHHAPLSMVFSKQESWSKLSFPSPGDLPDPGIKPTSLKCPALAGVLYHWEARKGI